MSIFKCKMCGGDLEFPEGSSIGICQYCGTKQTLPRLDTERKRNLYDRASHFRRNNDYDKAMSVYEQILNEDRTDAEAYWSLVLCRYGIEYVEDPATHKRVPTVNRTQYTSIYADEDYKSAIQYADVAQKEVYEQEAAAIDEIQRGILAISQKEEPFDVFICYKETDNDGRRTRDSVLANDLYHELTREGFKVFFARITLEDKLGQEYEPYIFAALNSAKVMVVLGTKPEFFRAVWVRNEWSRFLALTQNNPKKVLIPAFRDMDPYDLPEEFSHLQAQDMSKLGFMQDLIRGIKKLTARDEPQPTRETVVVSQESGNVLALLQRGQMALEDGEWEKADGFYEEVLNQNAQCSDAYLGKKLMEVKCKNLDAFVQQRVSLPEQEKVNLEVPAENTDEINAQKQKFISYDALCKNEIEEAYYFDMSYSSCMSAYEEALKTEEQKWQQDRQLSKALRFDGPNKNTHKTLQKVLNGLQNRMKEEQKHDASVTQKIKKEYLSHCEETAASLQEESYEGALQKCKSTVDPETLSKAAEAFDKMADYKDAEEQAEKWRKEAEQLIRKEKAAAKKKKKMEIIIFATAVLAVIIIELTIYLFIPMGHYSAAEKALGAGKFDEARAEFQAAGSYSNASERIMEVWYAEGEDALASENMRFALTAFSKAGEFSDAVEQKAELQRRLTPREAISAGYEHTVGLRPDGIVVVAGEDTDDGRCNISNWTDIITVSAGAFHTVGLHSDGTVVAVGWKDDGRCSVADWKDIIAVSAGDCHTVGLKSDGTVVATGQNDYNQCDVSDWTDIVAISAGSKHTVGLKSDGTVVAVGNNEDGQCNVSNWTDIIEISAGVFYTAGVKSDGTVVIVGDDDGNQCDVSEWRDIIAVSVGGNHIVGLRSDGTVLAAGWNGYGQCRVSNWTDIVEVSAGTYHTVGLKSDGTVVAIGEYRNGQCYVSSWPSIGLPELK